MTSASKPSGRSFVAVRQTPSTETESPCRSSPANAGPDPELRAPTAPSRSLDRPDLRDDPGEHRHHSRSRARTSMSSPTRSQSTASGRIASAIRSAAGAPGERPAAAEHDRGDEQAQLVDLVRGRGTSRRARLRPRADTEPIWRRPSSASASTTRRAGSPASTIDLGAGFAQGRRAARRGASAPATTMERRGLRSTRPAPTRAAAWRRSRRRPGSAGGTPGGRGRGR